MEKHAVLATQIVLMLPEHYEQVKAISTLGIATSQASFVTQAADWKTWHSKHLASCRLVLLVAWRVAEGSVYVHPDFKGQGFGKLLLHQLVETSEQERIWTWQASIFRENVASLLLHESCGFRLVGVSASGNCMGSGAIPPWWKEEVTM